MKKEIKKERGREVKREREFLYVCVCGGEERERERDQVEKATFQRRLYSGKELEEKKNPRLSDSLSVMHKDSRLINRY